MITLTSAMITALAQPRLRPCYFVHIEGVTDDLWVWSGIGYVVWNAQTWRGMGDFASIKEIAETTDLRATGLELQLSGVPSDKISFALQETRSGKLVEVWFGLLNETDLTIIADPFRVYKGRLDQVQIEDGPDAATITVKAESVLIDLERAIIRRFTHEDHQIDAPGDLFFIYVAEIQDKEVLFGG